MRNPRKRVGVLQVICTVISFFSTIYISLDNNYFVLKININLINYSVSFLITIRLYICV